MRFRGTLMGNVAISMRVMPESPDTNLEELKKEIAKKVKIQDSKIEPIAFGLKALIVIIAWPEEKDPDVIESELAKIKDVNSVEIIDFRRAIG